MNQDDYRQRTRRMAQKAEPARKTRYSASDPIADWLLQCEYIMYYPVIAHMLESVNAAVLLCKAWQWTKTETARERDGWFYWSQIDITAQTGLSKRRTKDARDLLEGRGILTTQVRGIPAVLWWHLEKETFFEQARAYIDSLEESKEDSEEDS